jgi:hypothetical protein
MAQSGKIGFIVDKREVVNGHVKLTIRMLASTKEQASTNELPIILNALAASHFMNPQSHVGFTYTFPFPLSQGFGFPYVFDMEFDEDSMLTLA